MKLALVAIAHIVLAVAKRTRCLGSALSSPNDDHARFPTVVAQTTEGRIMDGPRGLQLITPGGPKPVDQTPEGFLVYYPSPHLLHPLIKRNHLFSKGPTTSP